MTQIRNYTINQIYKLISEETQHGFPATLGVLVGVSQRMNFLRVKSFFTSSVKARGAHAPHDAFPNIKPLYLISTGS